MTTATTTTFEVLIIYNGLEKRIEANPHQAVQALLEHALNAFQIHQGRENLALFVGGAAQPIDQNLSVANAGITAESALQLRPRVVQGGA